MKRILLASLGLVALANPVFGSGHIYINNYLPIPYNQVFWAPPVPTVGNQAVRDASVQLQVWYGPGIISDASQLIPGGSFTIDMSWEANFYSPGAGHGNGGYYRFLQDLPSWQPGDTFTFQVRASGVTPYGTVDTVTSRSSLWQERANITPVASEPLYPTFSAGVAVSVPEPSTFALAGFGSAALLIFGRRKA